MLSDRQPEQPIIGLSVSFHDFGDYTGVGFPRPVALAGGTPLILPRVDEAAEDVLEVCDGIVLAGGRDIHPSAYGQEPHPRLGPTEPLRDAFELDLVRRAIDRGLPILGSCRGLQVLNAALGGTLVQDLSLVEEWADHPSDPGWVAWRGVERSAVEGTPIPAHPRHAVAVAAGSRLHRALGAERAEVGSHHHQALDRVAPDLAVVARAPDGVVEAVEMRDGHVVAVQWELQEEWRVDRRFLRVFEEFVAAAAGRDAEEALAEEALEAEALAEEAEAPRRHASP